MCGARSRAWGWRWAIATRTGPARRSTKRTTRTDVAIEIKPLEQFKIEPLIPFHPFGIDASYTNSALLMTIAVVLITALAVLGTRRAALVPGRWQSIAEMSYEFVADMVETNAGPCGME